MRYSGYLLNPGDMFQVDPGLVMFALGQRKASKIRFWTLGKKDREAHDKVKVQLDKKERHSKRTLTEEAVLALASSKEQAHKLSTGQREAAEAIKNYQTELKDVLATEGESPQQKEYVKRLMKAINQEKSKIAKEEIEHHGGAAEKTYGEPPILNTGVHAAASGALHQIRTRVDEVMTITSKKFTEELRTRFERFLYKVKAQMWRLSSLSDENVPQGTQRLSRRMKMLEEDLRRTKASEDIQYPEDPEIGTDITNYRDGADLSDILSKLTFKGATTWKTPWEPRDFLPAFAFVPRYLEVNQNACAAVYLRHPVARPGSAEVPTPYPEGVNETAFNWYLRRR